MDLIAICLSPAFHWSHQREINRLCMTSINMNKHFGNCALKRQIFEVPHHLKVCRLLCRFDFLSQFVPIYLSHPLAMGEVYFLIMSNLRLLAIVPSMGSDRRARWFRRSALSSRIIPNPSVEGNSSSRAFRNVWLFLKYWRDEICCRPVTYSYHVSHFVSSEISLSIKLSSKHL